MELLALIAVVICLAVVVAWYVSNEAAGAPGDKGFLAISRAETVERGETYRDKVRVGHSVIGKKQGASPPAAVAVGRRPRYMRRDEAAYRVKGRPAHSGKPPLA